ncbi:MULTISPECIES: hypothetical protein [unclassified Undibacterium]|uniref:hypothetical protein n=1 Tax=unclassified Undibacterium TaxID=2630295 RepID=UPI002AC8FE7E|nr:MULTISPECIES: hypothetical protein [unclassified Undibacterium]MEB0141085.1 hypothetical protein [Undibacterium sp. CCC2.1]MEB0174110.1 hypothetical protein [Undibacterium sp. CCC1.1]MEB0178065.1 hypothetical protein [Undibacterium sp. CCC3.4]MEB0217270.1 hypothetical protein [Undibacterium sp. 5I2]WPX43773.1 hypothetical protein RHM61_00615 [Undibacterium sp. CCC3.4]
MKNKHQEQLKRLAKLYHRNSRRSHFEEGIIVRHLYDTENSQKFSWWDDVVFILNDYRVNVAWTHPRFVYNERVEEIARAECEHLESPSMLDFMADSLPNYRKIGKSRKKIVSYTTERKTNDAYFESLRASEIRIARDPNNGIFIAPQISTKWTNWSRFVSICVPIEVHGTADLGDLANLTKRLLKRETSLEQEFPQYLYSQKNWNAEFQNKDEIKLLAHTIKQ